MHLWWSFLQQHQQSLEDQVGETGTDGDVVQQTLNVIHHHTAELRLIGIIKDLKQMEGGREGGETNEERDKRRRAGRMHEGING